MHTYRVRHGPTVNLGAYCRPPICNLKKYGSLEKNSADIRAELSRKLKKSAKIRYYKQFRLSC